MYLVDIHNMYVSIITIFYYKAGNNRNEITGLKRLQMNILIFFFYLVGHMYVLQSNHKHACELF